jgi:4-hydroxyphenylpyruvate dioxygenase-like putative hemolysin
MEYFLGGSAGMGLEAADIDFFVRVDPVEQSLDQATALFEAAGYTPHKASQYQDSDFTTLRKGDINLILIANPDSYTGRQRGFEICKYITHTMCVPLAKEHRKAIHKLAAGEDLT